jgi:hypothetical protein
LVSPENAGALADIVVYAGAAIMTATTAYDAVRDEDAQTLKRVVDHQNAFPSVERREH